MGSTLAVVNEYIHGYTHNKHQSWPFDCNIGHVLVQLVRHVTCSTDQGEVSVINAILLQRSFRDPPYV